MKLFEVRLDDYRQFFVEASSFDAAKTKVEKYMEHNKQVGLINEDGDLMNHNDEEVEVREIRILSEFIIK